MTRARIICIGNRYQASDDAGPRIYDLLSARTLPEGVELRDGGLGGLNLLPWLEGMDRVVFADTVEGFGEPGQVVILDADGLSRQPPPDFGHADGLAYLIHSIPLACDRPPATVTLVGVEGSADEETISRAADRCLELAAVSCAPVEAAG